MLISENAARKKWCPFVRVENSNRYFNNNSGGFQNSNQLYHCIGSDCMGWREFHLAHMKGADNTPYEKHGYCGYGERMEPDWP
jgi:hypothetical protein